MKPRYFIFPVFVLLFVISITSAQKTSENKPLVIGHAPPVHKAIFMPQPEYPKSAAFLSIEGEVSVSVTVDATGMVIEAKVASGHPFFHTNSLKAARETKFEPLLLGGTPVRFRTSIVYKFKRPDAGADRKLGIVNGKALRLPKPETTQKLDVAPQNRPGSIELKDCRSCEDIIERPAARYPIYVGYGPHTFEGEVGIRVLVDKHGRVMSAKAIFGHTYFRPMLEREALRARFKAASTDGERETIFVFKVTPPGKRANTPVIGVLNGRAIVLPKPEYSDELKTLCASGEVKLEVRVSESGSVLEAVAISGDELLHEPSIAAVKGAEFQPLHGKPAPYDGIVVYNFPSEKTCVEAGIVNGKWIKRPSFSLHPHAKVTKPTVISIRIGIDPFSGNVRAAKAANGHPLIRRTLEQQARGIRFHPSMINSTPFIVKGVITVTILPNGKVTF